MPVNMPAFQHVCLSTWLPVNMPACQHAYRLSFKLISMRCPDMTFCEVVGNTETDKMTTKCAEFPFYIVEKDSSNIRSERGEAVSASKCPMVELCPTFFHKLTKRLVFVCVCTRIVAGGFVSVCVYVCLARLIRFHIWLVWPHCVLVPFHCCPSGRGPSYCVGVWSLPVITALTDLTGLHVVGHSFSCMVLTDWT